MRLFIKRLIPNLMRKVILLSPALTFIVVHFVNIAESSKPTLPR